VKGLSWEKRLSPDRLPVVCATAGLSDVAQIFAAMLKAHETFPEAYLVFEPSINDLCEAYCFAEHKGSLSSVSRASYIIPYWARQV